MRPRRTRHYGRGDPLVKLNLRDRHVEPAQVCSSTGCREPQERPMGEFAIRVLALAIGAAALAVVPMVTPANAATINSKHIKKHKIQKSRGFSDPWSAGQARPVARSPSQAGGVCPGNG